MKTDDLLARLTDYWRRIQVAGALESLKDERDPDADDDPRKDNVIRTEFDIAGYRAGRCPAALVQRAFARLDYERERTFERIRGRNPNAKPPDPAQHINVVFSPFGLRIAGEKNALNVLFGTAKVDRGGSMSTAEADSDLPPVWIGRSCLAPTESHEDDVFPLADADRYYAEIAAKLRELETWPSAWTSAIAACDDIWERTASASRPLVETLRASYALTPGWIRFEERDPKRLTIIRMYEKIRERIEQNDVAPLYREVALAEHRRVYEDAGSAKHVGQMDGKNALAPSQRSALLAYLQAPAGSVTAVNGPPGTGKTTLVQSVVASEFVEAAVAGKMPPLYIAGAATNQAVANVIKAFREATDGLEHPWADRWIPGLGRRYGVYFRGSAGEGLNLAQGSLVCVPMELKRHNDYDDEAIARTIAEIEQRNNGGEEVPIDLFLVAGESDRVRKHFVAAAGNALGRDFTSVDDVRNDLHARLTATRARIVAYAKAADHFVAVYRGLGVEDAETFDHAAALLHAGARRAQESLAQTKLKHQAEEAAQTLREREEQTAESERLRALDLRQADDERAPRAREDAELAELAQLQARIDRVAGEFTQLGEPASFGAWFAETFLPWVRNGKVARLRALVRTAAEAGFNDVTSGTIAAMRAHLWGIVDGETALRTRRDEILRERSNREHAAAGQRDLLTAGILRQRRRREDILQSARDERARILNDLESACRTAVTRAKTLEVALAALGSACDETRRASRPLELAEVAGWIDTTARVEAFLLATHYWESRFLLSLQNNGWRDQANRLEAFRTMAMIAPCFVSTFDKMGSVFNIMRRSEVQPLWSFADTLIIDEAGQASPDKGAFAFALAKKAIVVGDNLQLPPVNSSEGGAVFASIAESAGLLRDWIVTSRNMLTGKVGAQKASGSIMRMATAASSYDKSASAQGMWLQDHFRCDPRIIAFCNKVWYTGETSLIPRRKLDGEHTSFIPHFGHINVVGKASSNSNDAEALAIMRWINEHGHAMELHYAKPLHEIVAVLTPFTKQRRLLRHYRDRKFPWSPKYDKPHDIVMGTVHALQGAERPVILFSTVYDRVKAQYFFDFEHTLLNVAVSRAKDAFIVVGNRAIFDGRRSAESKPSTVLAGFIFDDELFAVPPVPAEVLR